MMTGSRPTPVGPTGQGITQEENASLDHRCRMLCEADGRLTGNSLGFVDVHSPKHGLL